MGQQRKPMLQRWRHYESTTQAHDSMLEIKQVGVQTIIPESCNCAATFDQSVITLKYLRRKEHACQHYYTSPPCEVRDTVLSNSAKDRLNTTSNESLAGHAIAARPFTNAQRITMVTTELSVRPRQQVGRYITLKPNTSQMNHKQ